MPSALRAAGRTKAARAIRAHSARPADKVADLENDAGGEEMARHQGRAASQSKPSN
jgi:hypothetical protein